jgi:hypothetical protein
MAFALVRKPTMEELATQRSIDATMRQVIADPYKNPTDQPAQPTVVVGGAAPVKEPFENRSGWREPEPLSPPPGQDAIERLANEMLPHGAAWGAGNLASSVCASAVAPKHARVEVVDRDGEGDSSDVALSVIPSESVVKRRKVR